MHRNRMNQNQLLRLCRIRVQNGGLINDRYARVSTDGQTLDAQQAALREAGCAAKVYSEKISGAVADRPALAKAIGAPADGDTLVVCKLDRLARSTTSTQSGRLAQPSNHLPLG